MKAEWEIKEEAIDRVVKIDMEEYDKLKKEIEAELTFNYILRQSRTIQNYERMENIMKKIIFGLQLKCDAFREYLSKGAEPEESFRSIEEPDIEEEKLEAKEKRNIKIGIGKGARERNTKINLKLDEFYCMTCKNVVNGLEKELTQTSKGVNMLRVKCEKCGRKITKFVGKDYGR